MTTQEAVEHFGGQKHLIAALGLKARQTVTAWGDYPPIGRQYQIEVLTNGKLKASKDFREVKDCA
jgi:hypothetical protein